MIELETALLRDPDDLASLLVYADLLQSRADPRGEWISLQHAAMTRPDEPQLRAACERFLRAHEPALLGPLAAPVALARARGSGWGIAIEWRLGFFHSATVGLPAAASSRAAAEQMQALVDHPAARRLEQLTLGSRDHWAAWIKHRANLDVLRAARPEPGEESALPMLRKLVIHADLDSEVELGDLWSRYPSLEHAELSADRLGLGRIVAPSLRSLDIETRLRERDIAAVLAAECPSLAR